MSVYSGRKSLCDEVRTVGKYGRNCVLVALNGFNRLLICGKNLLLPTTHFKASGCFVVCQLIKGKIRFIFSNMDPVCSGFVQ